MARKYILTRQKKTLDDNVTLYRIMAVVDFGTVKEGTVGGFVQSTENLSQYGLCWIADDADVYGYAAVSGNAVVMHDAVVTGETPASERDLLLRRFKNEKVSANLFGDTFRPLKYLVNVNVLTTGFDAPNVDCIVLLRPTASPGLYYQMIGRGFRVHESKKETL
ncbi:MAG TPA: hypothetical protein DEB39_01870, partial [Planctomycetaceae bacterium]|nr:hypothetical protein [Planctomycetaceae bacterium]